MKWRSRLVLIWLEYSLFDAAQLTHHEFQVVSAFLLTGLAAAISILVTKEPIERSVTYVWSLKVCRNVDPSGKRRFRR